MGQVADYEKKANKKTDLELPNYQEVILKIGKQDLTIKDLTSYLSHQRDRDQFPLNEKTVRSYIKKLCVLSDGALNDSDFKKNGVYCFEPKFHAILLSILDSDSFGGYNVGQSLESRTWLHKQLAENISEYEIEPELQQKIKADPSYLNAKLESRLSEMFTRELAGMIHTMYHADYVVQYQFLIEAIDRIVALRRWMNEWEERMRLIRRAFAKDDKERELADKRTGKFKDQSIDTLLVNILAAEMKGKEYQFVSENEELSFPAAYVACKMYDVQYRTDHDLTAIFDEMEKDVSNDERYKIVMEMAETYFQGHEYLTDKILPAFGKIVKSQLVVNDCNLSAKDYKNIVRFEEECFAEKKKEITKYMDEHAEVQLDDEVIQAIMKIKDRSKLE